MSTIEQIRELRYPRTYSPAVAGASDQRNVLLVESESGPEGVAVRPFLLCQDWDQRVVIHWQDDHRSYTYTVDAIEADTSERFEFRRTDEPAGRVWLTPLTRERFEELLRWRDPEAGDVPRFATEEQFRHWFLPGQSAPCA